MKLCLILAITRIALFRTTAMDDSVQQVHEGALTSTEKLFRVAIIAAGAIRSFAFAERSWRRYLLEPWSGSVFIFAHVIASKECPISTRGVSLLQDIAEEVEVSWSRAPLVTQVKLEQKLPAYYKWFKIQKASNHGLTHGNIFDMWARRTRAYHMAVAYAEREEFPWDLIVMVRLDTGFYSPTLQLHQWHHSLMNYRNEKGHDGILIPSSCNFGGVCDRFAAGLPKTMDIYFKEDWIFDVLNWSLEPSDDIEEAKEMKLNLKTTYYSLSSELSLKCWLFMNNISNIYPVDNDINPLGFITLRTAAANAYCNRTRDDFHKYHPVHWTDKMTSHFEHASKPTGFDLIASPYDRCGPSYSLNVTEICANTGCTCGNYGR
eukprot:gene4473-8908_t